MDLVWACRSKVVIPIYMVLFLFVVIGIFNLIMAVCLIQYGCDLEYLECHLPHAVPPEFGIDGHQVVRVLLVAMPGAPSSVLAPSSDALCS